MGLFEEKPWLFGTQPGPNGEPPRGMNPDLPMAMMGFGAGLSQLGAGQPVNMAPYAAQITNSREKRADAGKFDDLLATLSPEQQKALSNMPRSMAEKLIGQLMEQKMFPQPAAPQKTIKGADGYNYYMDGSRVLPGVVQQAEIPSGAQTLEWRAQQAGLQPGTPEYQQFMVAGGKPPNGMSLNVDPDGGISFTQGNATGLTNPNVTSAQKAELALETLLAGLEAYEGIYKKGGSAVLPGMQRDALVGARRDLQLQMKELYNLGVLNGPDLALMDSLLVDPTSVGNIAMDAVGVADLDTRMAANIAQVRQQLIRTAVPKLRALGKDVTGLEDGLTPSAPIGAGIPKAPPGLSPDFWPEVYESMTDEEKAAFQ